MSWIAGAIAGIVERGSWESTCWTGGVEGQSAGSGSGHIPTFSVNVTMG